jgi:hypothetical protein
MIIMQQQQMRHHEVALTTQQQDIDTLRNDILSVKSQRQEDQMLIHRIRLQIQSQQFRTYRNQQQNSSPTSHQNQRGHAQQHHHSSYHQPPRGQQPPQQQPPSLPPQQQQKQKHQQQQQQHQQHPNSYGRNLGSPKGGALSPYQNANLTSRADKRSRNIRCVINKDEIECGNDKRTTVMVCNIPNRYTRDEVLDELDSKPDLKGTFDFLYLPIDFKNNCNLGYAFVNMAAPKDVIRLYQRMHGAQWQLSVRSSKICKLKWGRVQGKDALLGHFRGTLHLSETPSEFKPITIEVDPNGNTVCREVL